MTNVEMLLGYLCFIKLMKSGVGVLAAKPAPKLERKMSMEPKKNVLFLRMGPPMVQAASLRRKTGTSFWKILRDCKTLLVWNQPTVPWKSLVPCLVATLTSTELFLPYSAE